MTTTLTDRIVTLHAGCLRSASRMHRAVLRWRVVMCCRDRVSTRKTARAGKYFICVRIQVRTLRVTLACTCSHPHPLKGLRRSQQHNARKLCAMRCAHSSLSPHNLRYVACPQCASLRTRNVAAHPCAAEMFYPARPLRCSSPLQLIPIFSCALGFASVARTQCVLAKSGVRCCPQRLASCSPRQGQVNDSTSHP